MSSSSSSTVDFAVTQGAAIIDPDQMKQLWDLLKWLETGEVVNGANGSYTSTVFNQLVAAYRDKFNQYTNRSPPVIMQMLVMQRSDHTLAIMDAYMVFLAWHLAEKMSYDKDSVKDLNCLEQLNVLLTESEKLLHEARRLPSRS